jgi:hypothetical protein
MNEEAGRCEKPIVCPCTLKGKTYRLNQIVGTGKCSKCMCKRYGFACAPHCPIKSCPKGQVLSYPKGKCCKCVPAPCQAPKYQLECGCPRTCPALESSTPKCKPNTKECRKMVCSCPPRKYNDGKSCVDKHECPCMVDGKIMKVGTAWKKGSCHKCTCVGGVVKCTKECNIKSCPFGHILKRPGGGKCCHCESICEKPKPVIEPCQIIKKIGYFTTRINKRRCTSVDKLHSNSCKGLCLSETSSDDMKTDCTCCKPVNVVSKQVDMRCEDGSKHKVTHREFHSCICSKCSVK